MQDNAKTTCKKRVQPSSRAFTVLNQACGQDKVCLRCAAGRNRCRGWDNPLAFGNVAPLIMKMVDDFRPSQTRFLKQLAGRIAEHPVYWVILIGTATRGNTNKHDSHFGRTLQPAREAEGAARNSRLCDYVVLKRWKTGERGRTSEHALTSDPGNFKWNWLKNRVVELDLR